MSDEKSVRESGDALTAKCPNCGRPALPHRGHCSVSCFKETLRKEAEERTAEAPNPSPCASPAESIIAPPAVIPVDWEAVLKSDRWLDRETYIDSLESKEESLRAIARHLIAGLCTLGKAG